MKFEILSTTITLIHYDKRPVSTEANSSAKSPENSPWELLISDIQSNFGELKRGASEQCVLIGPIFFAIGSLLGGFVEMLNFFQQLLRISLKWNPDLMLHAKNMSVTNGIKKREKVLNENIRCKYRKNI